MVLPSGFKLLHFFDYALVGTRENRFDLADLGADLQVSPLQFVELKLADIAEAKLRPDARRGIRQHRVGERGYDTQGFGGGVEDGRQTRAAWLILLFSQSPGLVFDDVLIDGSDQAPGAFQRTRKLEAVEGLIEIRNDLRGQLRNGLVARGARLAPDKGLHPGSSG